MEPQQHIPTNPVSSQTPVSPQVSYSAQPSPAPTADDPGKTLAIISLVLWLIGVSLVGLILAIVAKSKSKKAGFKNVLATVSIVLNIIGVIITVIVIAFVAIGALNSARDASLNAKDQAGSESSTFEAIQSKSRDAERQADINSLHAQLEEFYAENGHYPSLKNMNDSAWRSENMNSLNNRSLADPANPEGILLVEDQADNLYGYKVTTAKGASCETDNKTCLKYVLYATFENPVNGMTRYAKNSLN